MSFLDIVPCDREVKTENPAIIYPFKLDNFQNQAQFYIQKGENVLVAAHTSAGKTMIAEAGIAYAKFKNKRAFYTSPIKTLSNQKFSEFSKKFENVGLLTGDIKCNPDAQCVIMTTEILRDMLYKEAFQSELKNLDCVIFDEVHYINDRDRGHVWEECIVKLPPNVTLIMLSATISEAEKFANWIGNLKQRPIHLITTYKRPVPLNHYAYINGQLEQILDVEKNFNSENYQKYIADFKYLSKREFFKPINLLNPFINYLQKKKLTPAIFFVFSRNKCLSYANIVSTYLTTGEEQAQIGHEIDKYLIKHNMGKELLDKMPQVIKLRALMSKGIGVHHSGLLSIMKEITEILFSKGLIKVLFATETFAVGVNMPTRTVIFTELTKHTNESEFPRMLKPDEYQQMSGRAGRRGLDKLGTVVHLPLSETYDCSAVKSLLQGKSARIDSKLKINYAFVLQMLSSNISLLDTTNQQFYLFDQHKYENDRLESEYNQLMIDLTNLNNKKINESLTDEQMNKIQKLYLLECKLQSNIHMNGITIRMNKSQEKNIRDEMKQLNKDLGQSIFISQIKDQYLLQETQRIKLNEKLATTKNQMNAIKNGFMDAYKECLNDLYKWEYITEIPSSMMLDSKSLTDRGIVASQIVSANEILLTELIIEGQLNTLDVPSLAAILSLFCSESRSFDQLDTETKLPANVKDIIDRVFRLSEDCMQESMIYQKYYSDKGLSDVFTKIAYRWAQGHSYFSIAADMEGDVSHTFEGDFCRTMLRLAHICDELIKVCGVYKCASLEKNMIELKSVLLRDIVTFDSLYLKI